LRLRTLCLLRNSCMPGRRAFHAAISCCAVAPYASPALPTTVGMERLLLQHLYAPPLPPCRTRLCPTNTHGSHTHGWVAPASPRPHRSFRATCSSAAVQRDGRPAWDLHHGRGTSMPNIPAPCLTSPFRGCSATITVPVTSTPRHARHRCAHTTYHATAACRFSPATGAAATALLDSGAAARAATAVPLTSSTRLGADIAGAPGISATLRTVRTDNGAVPLPGHSRTWGRGTGRLCDASNARTRPLNRTGSWTGFLPRATRRHGAQAISDGRAPPWKTPNRARRSKRGRLAAQQKFRIWFVASPVFQRKTDELCIGDGSKVCPPLRALSTWLAWRPTQHMAHGGALPCGQHQIKRVAIWFSFTITVAMRMTGCALCPTRAPGAPLWPHNCTLFHAAFPFVDHAVSLRAPQLH